MSLDVYLQTIPQVCDCNCPKCPKISEPEELYWANITHNLGKMAEAAGIYKALWHPEEIKAAQAKDIIEPLSKGLSDLKARPEYFEQFNASNGWGLYEHFVPFVEKYLNACIENPEAQIYVSI